MLKSECHFTGVVSRFGNKILHHMNITRGEIPRLTSEENEQYFKIKFFFKS